MHRDFSQRSTTEKLIVVILTSCLICIYNVCMGTCFGLQGKKSLGVYNVDLFISCKCKHMVASINTSR